MSKTNVDSNVDAVLPVSPSWAGSPNNVKLQVALDDLKNFTGGNPVSVDNTASPYAVALTDNVILVDATAGAVTLNLPAAATADGRSLFVKKVDSSINAVTLEPDGAETIEGAANLSTLDAQYDVVEIFCDGTEWFILSSLIA